MESEGILAEQQESAQPTEATQVAESKDDLAIIPSLLCNLWLMQMILLIQVLW